MSAAEIVRLLEGRTDRREERRVIEILRAATTGELNALLREVPPEEMLASIDNRLLGPDLHSELVDLLTIERLDELEIEPLAAVVHGLQIGHTNSADERALRRIFLSMEGERLTRLKNQVNMRVDNHDLEGLIFNGIDDEDTRREILSHFALQTPKLENWHEAKVLSDIDDTVLCALHDKRYPRGTIYPGILALYEALDEGPAEQPFSMGDLTFVTARPGDAMGLVENYSLQALKEAGISQMSMMTGEVSALLTKPMMADKKMENIAHYCLLFPEYDVMFIGDSGQGDVLVGQRMYEAHGDVVKAVFIHDVVATPQPERDEYARQGIWFVDTYVGAAVKARELDLISADGLAAVIGAARVDFDGVKWESPEQESAMRALLERDIAAAG